MVKMRKFTFTDKSLPEGQQIKEIDSLGYKKAGKSYQISSKSPEVEVAWTSKAGNESLKIQKLPLGRGKKVDK